MRHDWAELAAALGEHMTPAERVLLATGLGIGYGIGVMDATEVINRLEVRGDGWKARDQYWRAVLELLGPLPEKKG